MTFIGLIYPLLDAKRFRRWLAVDAIVRLDLMLEALDL